MFIRLALVAMAAGAVTASAVATPALAQRKPQTEAQARANPQSGFPNRNGPLSAMMVFVAEENVAEFNKPGTPRVVIKSDAKVGDVAAIKILFNGVAVTPDRGVDTTFDLKVLAPDGSIYGGADMKGVVAVRTGPAPADIDKVILDNRANVVAIRFEPKDPIGVYRVQAVLHDNVGKRDIPLTAQIELKK